MDRDEALKLLEGGEEGVAEWNRRRATEERVPDLSRPDLSGVDLRGCYCVLTHFADVDLSCVIGLDEIHDLGPRSVDHHALTRSKGRIPKAFLRGCDLQDWEIEVAKLYNPDLTPNEVADIQTKVFERRADKPLQLHNVFISYSHIDSDFVDALETKLDAAGIRFWRDIDHAVAGRLDKNVELDMRSNPIVVVVFSEHSVESDWVEHEVKLATRLREELK